METRKIRLLRQKYHISLQELGHACGVSPQRISEIELTPGPVSYKTVRRIRGGLEQVIAKRGAMLGELQRDCITHGASILDLVEEIGFEL